MIRIEVELQDWDSGCVEKTVMIPSNIRMELNSQSEYVIVDSTPFIPDIQTMDIWELNSIIEDINSENPEITAELLALIMDTVNGELSDDEFVRRIKENDFMFEDLSDINWKMQEEEIAACYIATVLGVPFDIGITNEILEFIGREEIVDYIDWKSIWAQYEISGFKLIEDIESEECGLYLIHWR